MEQESKKLTKKQLRGLRKFRRKTITIISIISLISLWFKIGLNPNWHFNHVVAEGLTLFILILMGILSNIRNDFPIFQFRKFEFTKEFSYSIITTFSLLFIFIIYKNIVDVNFITYIANLSLHDLSTIIVFITPILLLIIYLIYISFKILDDKQEQFSKKEAIYSTEIERNLNQYKSLTIKFIFIIMLISIWIKIGFNNNFFLSTIITELLSIFSITLLWIIGNIKNKLTPFYNCHFKIDRYFFYSLLLPYLLIVIYSGFNFDFRFLINSMDLKRLISLLVYMSPLFLISSILFYIGCRCPEKIKDYKKTYHIKKSKERQNVLFSLGLTAILSILLFIYCFTQIAPKHSLENILQAIIIFIPLSVVFYLIIYSEIREFNK